MNRNDWQSAFCRRKKRAASERGKRMANARWTKFRAERDKLSALDPIRVGGRIVERLVRIVNEDRAVERVFYEFDRPCDWERKRKEVFGFK